MDLFVYGTLRPDRSNATVLEQVSPSNLRPAKIPASAGFTLFSAAHGLYPYLTLAADHKVPSSVIHGFLAEIDEGHLGTLDQFEGVPDYYTRTVVSVLMNDVVRQAEAYVAASPCLDHLGQPIPDGIWRDPLV